MDVSSSEKPTVTVNSASVNVTASDAKKYSSDLFDLAELDKTVNDGYNNTVTITAGGTTYTVYIRRLLKPKITLNYGNSPYGEIMKLLILLILINKRQKMHLMKRIFIKPHIYQQMLLLK